MTHLSDVPVPAELLAVPPSVVALPPGQVGGNHSHPRTEVFVAFGAQLELVWRDETGHDHREEMLAKDQLILFIIPPHLPHAVINHSKTSWGFLLEFSDQPQHEVKNVPLVGN